MIWLTCRVSHCKKSFHLKSGNFYSSKQLQTLFFLTSFPGTVCLICFAQIAITFLLPNSTVQRCQNWITKTQGFGRKLVHKSIFFLTIALTLHALSICIMVCLFLNDTVAVTVHIEPLIAASSFMLDIPKKYHRGYFRGSGMQSLWTSIHGISNLPSQTNASIEYRTQAFGLLVLMSWYK